MISITKKIKVFSLFLLSISILSMFLSCSELTQEEIEQKISESKKFRKLNEFCENVPKPDGFRFTHKDFGGGNSFTIAIAYYYKTNISFSQVKSFYLEYFRNQGWKRKIFEDEKHWRDRGFIKYQKGKKIIVVEHSSSTLYDYVIGCKQLV